MAHRRTKVLCLGMSYPSLECQIRSQGVVVAKKRGGKKPSKQHEIDGVYPKIRAGVLTVMDGRDLARCMQTELSCNVDIHTVSQEKACIYRNDRHFDGNFNRANFVKALNDKFQCYFDEIILDYFWIPPSWDESHWKRSFFHTTLPDFARLNVLRPKADSDRNKRRGQNGGIIYLPFCFHCFKETLASFRILRKHYNLSFVRKHDLKKIRLWKGTQELNPVKTQQILGKRIDQEEIYCTFGLKHVLNASEADVSIRELQDVLHSLEDFADIRFLALELIAEGSTGSILGLQDPATIQRGFPRLASSTRKVAPTIAQPKKRTKSTSSSTATKVRKRSKSPDTVLVEGEVLEVVRPAKRRLFTG